MNIDGKEKWRNGTLQGKIMCSEENLPQCHFSTHTPICTTHVFSANNPLTKEQNCCTGLKNVCMFLSRPNYALGVSTLAWYFVEPNTEFQIQALLVTKSRK
jgi:hypothetical protein